MSRWWRRNGIPLAAIVAIVAGVVIIGGDHVRRENALSGGIHPVVATADGVVELAGAKFSAATTDITLRFGSPSPPPEGTKVVTATVRVDTGSNRATCGTPVLREAEGAGREWADASDALGIPYASDEYRFCAPDFPRWFTLTARYVVPEDADGPFFVDVPVVEAGFEFARLPVSP